MVFFSSIPFRAAHFGPVSSSPVPFIFSNLIILRDNVPYPFPAVVIRGLYQSESLVTVIMMSLLPFAKIKSF